MLGCCLNALHRQKNILILPLTPLELSRTETKAAHSRRCIKRNTGWTECREASRECRRSEHPPRARASRVEEPWHSASVIQQCGDCCAGAQLPSFRKASSSRGQLRPVPLRDANSIGNLFLPCYARVPITPFTMTQARHGTSVNRTAPVCTAPMPRHRHTPCG